MANNQLSDLDFVDDFYFSATFTDESDEENDHHMDINHVDVPVSDAKYAAGLQFQEALMGSFLISQSKNSNNSSNPSSEPHSNPKSATETGQSSQSAAETGQSSQCFCEICVERKGTDQMFATGSCVHSFCSECISKHVATKIQNTITVVTCPGLNCRAVLELDVCRTKLSKGVIDLWEEALCEETISASQRFYCPFKDCSALLVDDNGGGEVIRQSECPYCHRLFCAQCYIPWHSGVECEEYQRLNEDERGREDLMAMELAKEKKWSRCPKCRFYVERTEGCPHMVCRCQFEFCYGCGSEWNSAHGGCSRN